MAAKRKEKIENDTRTLIRLITGFQEKSENFQLCLTFAESNFKYHRFLTPDSHKIHRVINGLCEKFEVHSQKQKATDLQELTSAFLDQPGLDGRETGKTDVHYALLSLLLNLANSPSKTEFERKEKTVVPEDVDKFDWKSYLLNDLDLNFISYASASSDDEDDEVSQVSSTDEEEVLDNAEIQGAQHASSASGSKAPSQVFPSDQARVPSSGHNPLTGNEYTKLEQALVVEYWKGKGKEDDITGGHTASNLARDWNYYKDQLSLLHCPQSRCVVTEQQVLRETIWMLNGVTNLFIFKYSGNDFSLNPDIYVMHLTSESLESSLKPLMRKANQLCALQSFVTDVISQVTSAIQCGRQSGIPQTYQAFVTCVSQFLSDFRARLLELEKVIMKQEELISLDMLSTKLQPWFDKIQTVHGVYVSGVASVSSETSNSLKAAHLLDTLYQTLFELDLMSLVDKTGRNNVIMEMLIKSSQPLIEITSVWINNGQLIDPAEEFVIQRNREIKSLDETFWEKAFVSNHIISAEGGTTSSLALKEPSNEEAASSVHTSKNTTTTTGFSSQQAWDKSDSIEFIVSHGPKLLQPILADAILTGKSMEMLENLGKMGEVQDKSLGLFERRPSLFELFVSDLRAKIGKKTHEEQASAESASGTNSSKTNHRDGLLTKPLQVKGAKDSLLALNSSAMFGHCKTPAGKNKTDGSLPHVECGLSPLLRICDSCLYPHMRARYETVCTKLVHILKTEYRLINCIQAMQRYYLMSSGEIMYDFYTQIFHKMQKKEDWREPSLLEMYLHEAVSLRYPSDVPRLSVGIELPPSSHDKSPITATDCINLKYNVPWPLNVVISGKCLKLYNNIFCFLLQVKRAKYVQDELKFEDLAREQPVARLPYEDDNETIPRHKRIHRCHLFRFRLLYFINSLHNYVMTRILHSTGLEFATQLDGATDLEQIISIHRGYVQAIHERCLLHHKLSVLKEAVMKVLNLSLTFGLLWRQGVDFIHGDSILNMETELMRCIHFLSAILNNVIKRGSFPHLESLAFALGSSLQNSEV